MTHHDTTDEHRAQQGKADKKGRKADWDQEDVLKHKDHVTQSGRGLQIWGDEGAPDMAQTGTASQGTAERQATIGRGQEAQAEAQKAERERAQAAREDEEES